MRKMFKRKLGCSCNLCHPYKTGWQVRWKHREVQVIRDFEAQRKAAMADVISYLRETGERMKQQTGQQTASFKTHWCQP